MTAGGTPAACPSPQIELEYNINRYYLHFHFVISYFIWSGFGYGPIGPLAWVMCELIRFTRRMDCRQPALSVHNPLSEVFRQLAYRIADFRVTKWRPQVMIRNGTYKIWMLSTTEQRLLAFYAFCSNMQAHNSNQQWQLDWTSFLSIHSYTPISIQSNHFQFEIFQNQITFDYKN